MSCKDFFISTKIDLLKNSNLFLHLLKKSNFYVENLFLLQYNNY